MFLVGHVEPGAGRGDLRFGAADALSHGRLGNQERAGDLSRAQPADGAQGQRYLRRRRQGGMATQEQQRQRVVDGGALCGVGAVPVLSAVPARPRWPRAAGGPPRRATDRQPARGDG